MREKSLMEQNMDGRNETQDYNGFFSPVVLYFELATHLNEWANLMVGLPLIESTYEVFIS